MGDNMIVGLVFFVFYLLGKFRVEFVFNMLFVMFIIMRLWLKIRVGCFLFIDFELCF